MKVRIRDFVETKDGWIFSVADYNYEDGVRGLLRYVPDPQGQRFARKRRYKKLDFDESYNFLRLHRPEWAKDLHVVPFEEVVRIYRPDEELESVAAADHRVERIAGILQEAGISACSMGITGSMLLGLQGPSSDIDFVVYGDAWFTAREAIARAKAEGLIEEIDLPTWEKIYNKRKPEINFSEFVLHERRKGNRGAIDGTYFDLLFTREWDQISLPAPGRLEGPCRITARVTDSTYAFDSPAILRLEGEIGELFCFSHTYAGQALPGETVEASGVLERTQDGRRLVVGTTREARGEWIRSLSLLEEVQRQGGLNL